MKTHVNETFKKIRIKLRKIKPSAADRLIDLRNRLLKQGNSEESRKLDVIIAKTISEEGQKKAFMFKKYCNRNESGILSEMWNLKTILWMSVMRS